MTEQFGLPLNTIVQVLQAHSLWVHIVNVVLYELDASSEVRLVELVWNVPSQRTKLPPFLYGGVQESHCIQHWPPLWEVGVIQLFLADASIGTLQSCLHPLRWLIRELDACLEMETVILNYARLRY